MLVVLRSRQDGITELRRTSTLRERADFTRLAGQAEVQPRTTTGENRMATAAVHFVPTSWRPTIFGPRLERGFVGAPLGRIRQSPVLLVDDCFVVVLLLSLLLSSAPLILTATALDQPPSADQPAEHPLTFPGLSRRRAHSGAPTVARVRDCRPSGAPTYNYTSNVAAHPSARRGSVHVLQRGLSPPVPPIAWIPSSADRARSVHCIATYFCGAPVGVARP